MSLLPINSVILGKFLPCNSTASMNLFSSLGVHFWVLALMADVSLDFVTGFENDRDVSICDLIFDAALESRFRSSYYLGGSHSDTCSSLTM